MIRQPGVKPLDTRPTTNDKTLKGFHSLIFVLIRGLNANNN